MFMDDFAGQLDSSDAQVLADLRGFVDWQTEREGRTFTPDTFDDVAIRSYLLHLKVNGASRGVLRQSIDSLRRFYEWAQTGGLIAKSPFSSFDFNRQLLSRREIRRREGARFANKVDREIAHLRALNQLAEQLNRSADMRTLMNMVVETLVQVMGLRTAWAFLWTEAGFEPTAATAEPFHDFALAGCCGLPPGLEQDNRRFLCQPPDCHCQNLLRNGRLVRAVNVVECTRLRNTVRHAGDTGGLLFHATVPLISQDRSLGMINVATEKWEFLDAADLQFLSAAGAQVATALERARLYDLAQTHRLRLEKELEMARSVQRSLLPNPMPEIPGFTLVAEWRSAREVAGDFYDIFSLPDGRWGMILADVSGKGAPAALYMAMCRSLIRSEAVRHTSPAAVLTEVNRRLMAESASGMFVTAFYGILDPEGRSLTFANAGHDPPFLRRASGAVERSAQGGFIMGLFDQLSVTDESLRLERGDALVAYTDGVTDAVNQRDEDYGATRLATTISEAPAAAREMFAHILDDLATFTGKSPQQDDITLLILKSE